MSENRDSHQQFNQRERATGFGAKPFHAMPSVLILQAGPNDNHRFFEAPPPHASCAGEGELAPYFAHASGQMLPDEDENVKPASLSSQWTGSRPVHGMLRRGTLRNEFFSGLLATQRIPPPPPAGPSFSTPLTRLIASVPPRHAQPAAGVLLACCSIGTP